MTEHSEDNTPEGVALAGWASTTQANAQVVAVEVRGNRAQVEIEVDPGYREWVCLERLDGRWCEATSGNGPSASWLTP